MIPSSHELDDFIVEQRPRRVDRWLDRMDAAIVSVGRAIWRAVVDGFAAYGMAQCAPLIDTHNVQIEEQRCEGESALMILNPAVDRRDTVRSSGRFNLELRVKLLGSVVAGPVGGP
jgi:hypothetical protein